MRDQVALLIQPLPWSLFGYGLPTLGCKCAEGGNVFVLQPCWQDQWKCLMHVSVFLQPPLSAHLNVCPNSMVVQVEEPWKLKPHSHQIIFLPFANQKVIWLCM